MLTLSLSPAAVINHRRRSPCPVHHRNKNASSAKNSTIPGNQYLNLGLAPYIFSRQSTDESMACKAFSLFRHFIEQLMCVGQKG
jgi:hypothetical protein